MLIDLLILVMLWIVSIVITGFTGFMIGKRYCRVKIRSEPAPLSKETQREIEKQKVEYENFLNYDGREQRRIDV